MKSAHFHDHQQEEDNQFLVDTSCYGLSCYQNHNLNVTRDNTNSRDVEQHIYDHNINQVPISQDLGLHSFSIENFKAYELQHLARMKHKLSITGSYSENRDIISCNPTSSTTTEDFISNNNIQRVRYDNDNNQDMMLKTYSQGCHIKSDQLMNQIHSSEESMFHSFDTNSCYTGTFSQIFPTLNVSNLNQPSSSFDINLPALDSFGSTTFNGSSSYQPSAYNAHNLGSLFKDNCFSYGVDQINRKVRKEKLGDRISALQQMVAPFGKV
ncbi:hypothetical protein HanOQP8_Chr00c021g0701491 [Helianthus annuus]|nr:hypothetical protein HanOQP8_Chr00c021g0701491 [Helianthus annuus]